MKRLDTKGEGLICEVMGNENLNHDLIDKSFTVSEGKVFILNTAAIKELFQRATLVGIQDPFVAHYLERISDFARSNVRGEEKDIFEILINALRNRSTTSENMLNIFGRHEIKEDKAIELIHMAVSRDDEKFKELTQLKSLSYETIQKKDLFEPKNLNYL